MTKYIFYFTTLMLAAIGCSGPVVTPVDTRSLDIPGPDSVCLRWADSVLNTLTREERIGQLIMLRAPADEDTTGLAAFGAYAAVHSAGLIEFSGAEPEAQKWLTLKLRAAMKVPIITALDMNAEWLSDMQYPSFAAMGGAAGDSALFEWGRFLALRSNQLGADIVFTSAPALTPRGSFSANSLGSESDSVSAKSLALVRGMASQRVIAAVRPALTEAHIPQSDTSASFADYISPLKKIAYQPNISVQALTPGRDTLKKDLPSRICNVLYSPQLRDSFYFSGIFFSQDLSALRYGDAVNTALKSLKEGADVAVNPPDVEALISTIGDQMNAGTLSEKWLAEKVRRVLYAKAWTGARYAPSALLIPEDEKRIEARVREAVRSTMVMVRDKHFQVPLKNLETDSVLVVLPDSRQDVSVFIRTLKKYTRVHTTVAKPQKEATAVHTKMPEEKKVAPVSKIESPPKKQEKKTRYRHVIYAVFADSSGKPDETYLHTIRREVQQQHAVTVLFGPASALPQLDSATAVLLAHSDTEINQEIAAQCIAGGSIITARLSASVSGKYPAGTGLVTKKQTRIGFGTPEELGAMPDVLKRVDSIVYGALAMQAFPGCQILAMKDGKVFFNKAYGTLSYDAPDPVTLETVYDVASITKVAATTLTAIHTFGTDSAGLHAAIDSFIPDLDTARSQLARITVEKLLVHKAGLSPALPMYGIMKMIDTTDTIRARVYSRTPDSLHTVQISSNLYLNPAWLDTLDSLIVRAPVGPPDHYEYSDFGFYMMKEVLEHIHGVSLDTLVDSLFYNPLGLRHTLFKPLRRFSPEQIAPTEDDGWWRKETLRGYVHDPAAGLLGGVSGHAGLFSRSQDLAILLHLLMQGGEYGGRRYLSEDAVNLFTSHYTNSHRGLGFDMQSYGQDYPMVCNAASAECFGHTGFTGTCFWADPVNGIVYVFLSNRVHPSSKNTLINQQHIRQSVQAAIYESFGLIPPCLPGEM